ncbi:MAG TPA: ribosome biogenesis GTPase YlqF [Rhodocyclaceae bacterium]|nr:ribosome biogenesis GTPase YlqF [Rhodocyclaceae bacterium]
MAIQWFPGHMTSARKKAAETMARTDVVIEVVDARLPEASSNPMIKELRQHRQRPCLKVLNKADLADPVVTKAWLDHYNRQPGVKAIAISSKKPAEVARIPNQCQSLAPHRNDNIKPLRMMIMGIPNVGKSTIMNALLKRKVAAVGDEPAVTKSQQSLDISPSKQITDTPGMLWPKIQFDSDGYMLAASHAVGVNAVIEDEVAIALASILLARYPALLTARYGFSTEGMDSVGVVEAVARKRGCFLKGKHAGELDMEKASIILLTEYRGGILGRISLETPETRATMLAEAAANAAMAVKQADKADEAEPSE